MPGANRATQVFNFYESTIANSDFSAGATSFSVASTPTVDGTNGITSATTGNADTWIYLVIDPDSSSNREIVIVKTHTSGSTSFSDVERDYDGRQEAAGAAAIAAINASSATAMMANATDGTSIDVASATDQVLVYDATDTTAKQVNVAQLPFASIGLVIALGA